MASEEIKDKFDATVRYWEDHCQTGTEFSVEKEPAPQQAIIDMGREVLPLIRDYIWTSTTPGKISPYGWVMPIEMIIKARVPILDGRKDSPDDLMDLNHVRARLLHVLNDVKSVSG